MLSVTSVEVPVGQSADRALQLLVNTLKHVAQWEDRLHSCRGLVQLLERNKEIRKFMESKFNFRCSAALTIPTTSSLTPFESRCKLSFVWSFFHDPI